MVHSSDICAQMWFAWGNHLSSVTTFPKVVTHPDEGAEIEM
jgi:hypothetical protein